MEIAQKNVGIESDGVMMNENKGTKRRWLSETDRQKRCCVIYTSLFTNEFMHAYKQGSLLQYAKVLSLFI